MARGRDCGLVVPHLLSQIVVDFYVVKGIDLHLCILDINADLSGLMAVEGFLMLKLIGYLFESLDCWGDTACFGHFVAFI